MPGGIKCLLFLFAINEINIETVVWDSVKIEILATVPFTTIVHEFELHIQPSTVRVYKR